MNTSNRQYGNSGIQLEFEQWAILAMAGCYPILHFTLIKISEFGKIDLYLPFWSLLFVPIAFTVLALLPILFRSLEGKMEDLAFTSYVIYMMQLVYLSYLNSFESIIVMIYWITLFFFCAQLNSRSRLVLFLILVFVTTSVGLYFSDSVAFPKYLFFLWYPILSFLMYWVIGRKIDDTVHVTQQKSQILEQEQLFRMIFEQAPYGIAITSRDKSIIRVNNALANILGYTIEEMLEMDSLDVTHPEDVHLTYELFDRASSAGLDNYNTEKRYIKKNGSVIICNVSVRIIRDINGTHVLNIGVIEDITDRKRDEYRIKDYASRLKQSNQDLEEFAYVVSHDLREPLRMISSYLQLLRRKMKGNLTEELEEFIFFATNGAKRMDLLIKDLLGYSRVGRENLKSDVDLDQVLKAVEANLSVAIKENQAVIHSSDLPVVKANQVQITALLQNLIQNAIKYRKRGVKPEIWVQFTEHDDHWKGMVADNGLGIKPNYHESIFTIFNRIHNHGDDKGTGIGLAICKKVIKLHGGNIWVESEYGHGAQFYFTIPIESEEEGAFIPEAKGEESGQASGY